VFIEHEAHSVAAYMHTMRDVNFKLRVIGLNDWLTYHPQESGLRVVGTPFVLGDFDNDGTPTEAAMARQAGQQLPTWTMEGCYIKFVICGDFPIGIVSHDDVPDGAVVDRVFFEYVGVEYNPEYPECSSVLHLGSDCHTHE
jgi:hypothetical protein